MVMQFSTILLTPFYFSTASALRINTVKDDSFKLKNLPLFITEKQLVDRFAECMGYWEKVGGEIPNSKDMVTAEGKYVQGKRETATVADATTGQIHHGGDRMKKHGYAPIYARHIAELMKDPALKRPTIVEVGILTGTGLAMWTDLFPQSKIFGFDYDTRNYENNLNFLQSKGYNNSLVTVKNMDQMADNNAMLAAIFKDVPPSIVVDDGCHLPECNFQTFNSFLKVLSKRFVYFLEDLRHNKEAHAEVETAISRIQQACPDCTIDRTLPKLAVISKL